MPSSEQKCDVDIQRWYWPPRPFTFAVAGCVAAAAFVVCFPAAEVPHADIDSDGKYGPHFGTVIDHEHGWPLHYARCDRLTWILTRNASTAKRHSAWQPWEATIEASVLALAADVAFWLVVVGTAAASAQYWRSKRRSAWQLGLRDLLVLTAVAGLVCAWYVSQRRECARERVVAAAIEEHDKGLVEDYIASAVPAWLPESARTNFHNWFGRARYAHSNGNSSDAYKLKALLTLAEHAAGREFPQQLRQIPQLEALDLGMANLAYDDEVQTKTILSQCPPMPNLRGINLYNTGVKDADLVWLASCPRLERIALSGTHIGDQGLEYLSRLPALRVLTLWNCDISDEGCRSLAKLQSLEVLAISSPHVRATGIAILGELKNLRRLSISATASPADFEALQRRLPQCEIDSHSF